jgi:hypothetical protein
MRTYIVQAHDTPATIAHRFTGNRERYSELIAANPQKGLAAVPHGLAGSPTFDSLHVGEHLNLPHAWLGLGAIPSCSPQTNVSIADAWNAVAIVIEAATLRCSSVSPYPYARSQEICNFQFAYQSQGGGPGLPFIPNDQGGGSPIDGECGPNTIAAMNNYLAYTNAAYRVACNPQGLLLFAIFSTTRSVPSGGGGAVTTGGGSNYGAAPRPGPTAPRQM